MRGYGIALFTCLAAGMTGCNSDSIAAQQLAPYTPAPAITHLGVPFMDLMDYQSKLFQARGLLPQNTCAMDLRVRPSLRDAVLTGGHDFGWFIADGQYDPSARQSDESWVDQEIHGIQQEELAIQATLSQQGVTSSPWIDPQARDSLAQFGFYPGFYDLNSYASYQVGPVQIPWYQPDGYVYKVFFEFKNPETDLTPDQYHEFSRRLHDAGFQGDSKVPLMTGWVRFLWNNVIVHSPTVESAVIAEQVGLTFFGPSLSSYSRGVDAQNALTNN